MSYNGIIISADLAGLTGAAEGCPGEIPHMEAVRFKKEGDDVLDVVGNGIGWIAERLTAPRAIGGRIYGPGEAIEAGLIRLALEMPIMNPMIGNTNAEAQLITKGLWAGIGGFARKRGVMVRSVSSTDARKLFLGFGRAGKDAPKDFAKREAKRVCEALGWSPPNLDAADAGAVHYWAIYQWARELAPQVQPLWLSTRAQGRAIA